MPLSSVSEPPESLLVQVMDLPINPEAIPKDSRNAFISVAILVNCSTEENCAIWAMNSLSCKGCIGS
ncbi:hypothetical protein D3C75_1363970 [compost metagenome]